VKARIIELCLLTVFSAIVFRLSLRQIVSWVAKGAISNGSTRSHFKLALAQAPRAEVAFLATFLCLFLLWNMAQLFTRDQYEYPKQHELFPLTRFAMFAFPTPGETVSYARFEGYDEAGEPHAINPARMFSALAHVGLFTRTTALARLLQSDDETERRHAIDEVETWARSLARAYPSHHATALSRIDFVEVTHSSVLGEGARIASTKVLLSVPTETVQERR
jgi:hypothetical protein